MQLTKKLSLDDAAPTLGRIFHDVKAAQRRNPTLRMHEINPSEVVGISEEMKRLRAAGLPISSTMFQQRVALGPLDAGFAISMVPIRMRHILPLSDAEVIR